MHVDLRSEGSLFSTDCDMLTDRLRFRRVDLWDFEKFRDDPKSCLDKLDLKMADNFSNFLQPQSRDATVAIHWDGFWMIHREGRKMIGACACRKFPNAEGEVEIAYGIAPDFQNKGLATE